MSDDPTMAVQKEEIEDSSWEDVKPQDEWIFYATTLRLEIAHKLSSARNEQGVTQDALAKKTKTTSPALSRFFRGRIGRLPNLETLVKLAWGLNKRLEFNLVDLHSRNQESAKHSPAKELLAQTLLPSHIDIDDSTSEALKYARLGRVRLRRFNVDAGPRAEPAKRAVALTNEHRIEHVWTSTTGLRRLCMQISFCSREIGATASMSFPLATATLDVDYILLKELPDELEKNLPNILAQHSLAQALPVYKNILRLTTEDMT